MHGVNRYSADERESVSFSPQKPFAYQAGRDFFYANCVARRLAYEPGKIHTTMFDHGSDDIPPQLAIGTFKTGLHGMMGAPPRWIFDRLL